jgi:hypothetical protein
VRVAIDGKLDGVIEGDTGIVFRDITAGAHRIEAVMPDHQKQVALTFVGPGEVATHRLRPFQPRPDRKLRGDAALVVHTEPEATIDSRKLGWKKIAMSQEPFVASELRPGTYKMTFCNAVMCMDYEASIRARSVLSLTVEFEPGRIRDTTREDRAEWASWRTSCAGGDRASCQKVCAVESAVSPSVLVAACEVRGSQPPLVAKKARPSDEADARTVPASSKIALPTSSSSIAKPRARAQ